MNLYVLYRNGWPVGVFDSYEDIAERIGVKLTTARYWGTAAHKRRCAHYRIREGCNQHIVETVHCDEAGGVQDDF